MTLFTKSQFQDRTIFLLSRKASMVKFKRNDSKDLKLVQKHLNIRFITIPSIPAIVHMIYLRALTKNSVHLTKIMIRQPIVALTFSMVDGGLVFAIETT